MRYTYDCIAMTSSDSFQRHSPARFLCRWRGVLAIIVAAGSAALPAVSRAGVVINGVEGELLDNIYAHLQIDDETCESPDWRVRSFYRQAEVDLRQAIEAYGYYSATVTKSIQSDDECWTVTLNVDLGRPVLVRSVAVGVDGPGAALPEFEALRVNVPIAAGSVFSHAEYDQYKSRFTNAAGRLGFFDAKFVTSRIDVYPGEFAADIVLNFETGIRYRFGSVTFDQEVINPELAERYIDFEPGQDYEVLRIRKLNEELLRTGYFSGVDIRTTPRGAPDYAVDASVRLIAAKHQSYNAGIGYGTDSGPKLRAGFIDRRVNKFGHQAEINMDISPIIAEIGASYRLPLNNPRQQWLLVDAGYRREHPDTSESELYKTGIKRFQRQGEHWLRTVFVDYSIEDYVVGPDSGRVKLFSPGVSWKRSIIGAEARPLRGASANFRISGATDVLLSDTSYLQAHAYGKAISPLWDGARLIGRLELGATMAEDFVQLPASLRFFAGGDVSVRGYEYKSLGPTDDLGNVLGGTLLAWNWISWFGPTGRSRHLSMRVMRSTGYGKKVLQSVSAPAFAGIRRSGRFASMSPSRWKMTRRTPTASISRWGRTCDRFSAQSEHRSDRDFRVGCDPCGGCGNAVAGHGTRRSMADREGGHVYARRIAGRKPGRHRADRADGQPD